MADADGDAAMIDEPAEAAVPESFPAMALAQTVFLYSISAPAKQAELKAKIMGEVERLSMPEYCSALCEQFSWTPDAALLARLTEANTKELEGLVAAKKDAEENQGDVEVLDALLAISTFHSRTGAKELAYEAFEAVRVKPKISSGKMIDALMGKIRVALFHADDATVRDNLAAAHALIEKGGGDWDRANRLKVYEAFHCINRREIKKAADLLLAGVSTFTAVEICDYETFILYACITNVLTLPRVDLKKKIVDGPEILQVIREMPELQSLLAALYDCEYSAFMRALPGVSDMLENDRYFSQHTRHIVRELRVLVYSQFLGAYKSVTVEKMASNFGVSPAFLDGELSRFIAAARLDAKVDKVAGLVETNRPNTKSSQYQTVIKQGDLLLTRIQKLARVIDV